MPKWNQITILFLLLGMFVLSNHLQAVEPNRTRKTERPRLRKARQRPVPEGVTAHRNLEYATVGKKKLLLDLYIPKDVKSPPLLVWIHGGGWRNGNKNGCRLLNFTTKGYAIASINYRLSHEAIFPAQIHDCKGAIRWLRANSKKYHYNSHRIGISGSSAGGHLVALLGTSSNVKELEGDVGGHLDQSSEVQAVCDLFGPTDFLKMDEQVGGKGRMKHLAPRSPESLLIGGPLLDNKEKVARANPITYVDKSDPPFLILHGEKDFLVPHQQSIMLEKALKQAGATVSLYILKGAAHGGREFSTPENNKHIADFFNNYIRVK